MRGGVDEAITFVNEREKPLAMYVFTDDDGTRERFERETSAGMLVFGTPVLHIAAHELPFGGVGASGMGAFHGRQSLETFSHRKSVFDMPMS
ncbi:aldehyde dehydrogenase family protein [Streptomyces sp. TS71-3]|uniref:aldehyde dehydrogenase family protein n=1 Tax=Streptomyces sp. TS71-3 TaxID=2733862 RepID=UPI001B176ABB|nr:aldehyde dehydrogenase family protein [Streptomyces sp. TS71-3]GHJ38709.1 hypothetical protein Sm713_43180 [Streptomyces sp. TS71-3]